MAHETDELKFLATPEKGEVSALLMRPADASHLLVLGHGASTNMRHATLRAICEKLGRRAKLHPLDTSDHGFRVLKRSRKSEEDVFAEIARVTREWAGKLK